MGFEGVASLIFGVGLLLVAILVFVFDFFSKKKELKDHIWRANLFRKQEKYQEAIKAYLEALALDGDLVEPRRNLAWIYRKLERYSEAIRQYIRVVGLEPEDYQTHNRLGLLYGKINKEKEAIEHYEAALELEPNFAIAHANLGMLYHNSKNSRMREAIECYESALKIEQTFIMVRNLKAQAHLSRNEYDAAIMLYEGTVRIAPEPEHYLQLGLAFNRTGRHERAISNYQKALRIDSDSVLALTHLGKSYSLVEKYDEAETELNNALNINANHAPAQYQLAIVLTAKDQLDQAMDILQQAIQNDPTVARTAKSDTNLQKLHQRPEFDQLVEHNEDEGGQ
jgi:tetratricopeptide (TPR) repeat protein